MTIEEIRDRLLELARTHRVTEEDADLLEQTEVELDAAFIELSRCRERIKRLEQAGNELAKWLDRNTPATILNDWTAAKEAKP